MVTRIDRLARSMRDLQAIVATLKDKGAHLAATEQPVDTSSAAGKAFFDILGVFAEFETNLRRERQAEGVAVAKQRATDRGRPPMIDMKAIKHRLAKGLSPPAIARELRLSRGTVYTASSERTNQRNGYRGRRWETRAGTVPLKIPKLRKGSYLPAYLNNVVEADHGKLKLLLRPVRGFKTLKTAYATIKGFEVMRALRKGQARAFALQGGIIGEARIVERAFGVGPCALTEAHCGPHSSGP